MISLKDGVLQGRNQLGLCNKGTRLNLMIMAWSAAHISTSQKLILDSDRDDCTSLNLGLSGAWTPFLHCRLQTIGDFMWQDQGMGGNATKPL